MVTKLYYFKSKKSFLKWCREREYSRKACIKAWTGQGYYYARGKNHISKHTPHLDKRRGKKLGRGPWRHMHDLGKAVKKLDSGVKRVSLRHAKKHSRRLRGGKRLEVKLAKAIHAKTIAKAVKKARQLWVRIPAVRSLAAEIWEWIPKKYKQGRHKAWTYIMALALAYNIYKRAKETGADPQAYDWEHLVDWSLGYRDARELVKQVLGKSIEEVYRESYERWKHLQQLYSDEERAAYRLEKELNEVARYELEHLDELLAL